MTQPTGNAPTSKNYVSNAFKLPLQEKILAILAILIAIGFISVWSQAGRYVFDSWFMNGCWVGAVAVIALLVLRVTGKKLFPPAIERHVLPIASLLPALGFLVEQLTPLSRFLTVGGAIAMAYISAMTYWRRHIPDVGAMISSKDARPGQDAGASPAPGPADPPKPADAPPSAGA